MNAINHVGVIFGSSYDRLVSWVKPGGKLVVSIDAHNPHSSNTCSGCYPEIFSIHINST